MPVRLEHFVTRVAQGNLEMDVALQEVSPFRALGSIQNAAHALQEVCFCKEGSSSGDGLCGPGSYSGIGQSS